MSSWRDGLSEDAQGEMDSVLTAAVAFAQRMLEVEGAFYPYSVRMSDEGETGMSTAPASSADPVAHLVDGLSDQRSRLKAAAVVAAVHLESLKADAVRVDIEHRDGACLTIVLPYTRKRLRKKVEFGEMQSMVVDPRIWGP